MFRNWKRAGGAIAAGIAGGVAVVPQFSLSTPAHFAVLAAAVVFGSFVFLFAQVKETGDTSPEQAAEVRHDDHGDKAALPPVRPARPSALAATAGAVLALVRRRRADAERRLRLRPEKLPPKLTTFTGRLNELQALRTWHATASARDRVWTQGARGPRMFLVYGRPGVGKSALVNEFAHELKGAYPHGQLYMNMGVAGGRKSEREILREFLRALGWPEEEFRAAPTGDEVDEVEELGKTFRAATAGRRLLVVLDAARDSGQVEAVLPGGDKCTVIVTSRANLSGSEYGTLRLDTPDPGEAAAILQAYLTGDTGRRQGQRPPSVETIAEATYLCGRQPIALRAVGDRARTERGGLGEVVRALRDPRSRLDELAYGARDVAERIGTEYGRITRRQQEALQALALVGSHTFVPWVLQPMLKIELAEAGALMAALSEVSLLDEFGTDPSGFPRYGFSPLIRLFAERELNRSLESAETDPELLPRAKARFRQTSAVLAKRVIAKLEPGLSLSGEPEVSDDWIPSVIASWERRVLSSADFWVRSEFPNLIDAVLEAHDGGFDAITWMLGAQLSDSDVAHPYTSGVADAFTEARAAARAAGEQRALPSVLLAEGSSLIAAERYTQAIAVLMETLRIADDLPTRTIMVRANRLIGQAEQRRGRYEASMRYLRAALAEAGQADPDGLGAGEEVSEARIAAVLSAENDSFTTASHWRVPDAVRQPVGSAGISYTEHLVAARRARRLCDARTGAEELRMASEAIDKDEEYAFQLRLERLLLGLEGCGRKSGGARVSIIAEAAYLAIAAAEADAAVSSAEARIMLARALLDEGRPAECLRTLAALRLEEMAPDAPRLRAQFLRLQGEADLAMGRPAEAEYALAEAVRVSAEFKDVWGEAEARLALGRALLPGKPMEAQVTLLPAVAIFEQCGDRRNARRALALLAPPTARLAVKAVRARGLGRGTRR